MIARTAAITLLVALAAAAALVAAGGDGPDTPTYRIELRNAYNLSEGGDFKLDGVRAGSIEDLTIDRRKLVAIVTVRLDQATRARLRAGVTCESRPQSLIGEYFVSCSPGRGAALANGATVPLERTRATIPQDLVNNIFRVPVRQRLTLVLGELGVGLAGRGDDLNDAIRDGVPALRETARLIEVLAGERRTLARLVTDANEVVGALADRRREVSRFVRTAGAAADTAASRRQALAEGFDRLPGFLAELRATMTALDRFSVAQTPVAARLGRVADPLRRFLDDVDPFARSARPAIASLARASGEGRRAVADARPLVRQLDPALADMPELSRNLRFTLEHLDDRSNGVEHDERAVAQLAAPGPGGDRYNGLEGFLQYGFDQGQDITTFNQNGHFLILDVLAAGNCALFADSETVRNNPALERDCSGNVFGPRSPGIHDPDPGKKPPANARRGAAVRDADSRGAAAPAAGPAPAPDGLLDFLMAP